MRSNAQLRTGDKAGFSVRLAQAVRRPSRTQRLFEFSGFESQPSANEGMQIADFASLTATGSVDAISQAKPSLCHRK